MVRAISIFALLAAVALALPAVSAAQAQALASSHSPTQRARVVEGPRVSADEGRAAERFRLARKNGALSLHAFLEEMPKGADLHMHLSGAVYAETFLKYAAEDGLCVDPVRLALLKSTEMKPTAGPKGTLESTECASGDVPAVKVLHDQKLYDALVDSFSMRGFVASAGKDGHDHFFSTFDHFGAVSKKHAGDWLDELATRAAAQNVQYLEVMQTPEFSHAARLGYAVGWPTPILAATSAASSVAPDGAGAASSELAALREKLLAAGLREEVAVDRAEFDAALTRRRQIERCATPEAAAACAVKIRFLYQVLRAFPPQQVFAQTLLAFEVASVDPNVVGINFVQPEDAYLAMSEYHRQMLMLAYLHSVYPAVHISLHAGELAPGLVPPAGLSFHIRQAVELGHAQRIGHGVDVMYESDPFGLLREMAARHVMVEINLTSNDVILGVGPNHHSLPEYLAAHVPVALSTDDEGVSRIDLTHEYVRAATDFHLQYADLKAMARTSLEHAFLPGLSLWAAPDDFTQFVAACKGQKPGARQPAAACAKFLSGSERAAEQWELESRFRSYESHQESVAVGRASSHR